MGPLQQGSKEARSMSELKNRLEGLLEALFMRILDSPSNALLERWGGLPCAACGHTLDSISVNLCICLALSFLSHVFREEPGGSASIFGFWLVRVLAHARPR